MSDTETNKLLCEIRDLLASREAKYDEHLAKIQKEYGRQGDINAGERQKSVRIVFAMILLAAALVVFAVLFTR